ncbi:MULTISPECIES: hypothetical protein [Leuconostoc]|uniref:Type II CBASS E2 protein domain-containing protein n=1 Tax=Leuconostoc carnosum (strain JB16) TaxID=1229758 RepID=K0DFN9_LEUCJ|nr:MULTISPECIES: hypothetical protein [Leuconostoc]AFT82532.1 hypothetical protein C270_08281 [Leuconostoc carnosum JB16]MBZ5997365.1 hypothetical protein [Leuconostoc gasicomitatum]SPJ44523.1 conserved hypothetical protein [Leuconostoc carnosum]
MKIKKSPLKQFYAKFNDCLSFFQHTKIISQNTNKRQFTIEGTLSDSSLSRTYEIRVEYSGLTSRSPKIYILNLQTDVPLSQIPHVYGVNDDYIQICLTYPAYVEYRKENVFSESFFLWTVEWLVFFELFEITNTWFGNGIHLEVKKNENENN